MTSYILGSISTLLIFFMSSLYLGILLADIFNAPPYSSFVFPALFLFSQYLIFPSLLKKIFAKIRCVEKNEKMKLFEKALSSGKNLDIIFE